MLRCHLVNKGVFFIRLKWVGLRGDATSDDGFCFRGGNPSVLFFPSSVLPNFLTSLPLGSTALCNLGITVSVFFFETTRFSSRDICTVEASGKLVSDALGQETFCRKNKLLGCFSISVSIHFIQTEIYT